MKKLPYFKFKVSEWIMGRIFDMPDKVQGAFIVACCHYWHKECSYSIVDFRKKITKKRYDLLKTEGFLIEKNDTVLIPFLDEQFIELSKNQKHCSEAGKAGAIAKKEAAEPTKRKQLDKDKEQDKDKEEYTPSSLREKASKDFKEFDFSIVPELYLENVYNWLKFKREKRQAYKPAGFKMLIKSKLKEFPTPDLFSLAVAHSMSLNYSGIYGPKGMNKTEKNPANSNFNPNEYKKDK